LQPDDDAMRTALPGLGGSGKATATAVGEGHQVVLSGKCWTNCRFASRALDIALTWLILACFDPTDVAVRKVLPFCVAPCSRASLVQWRALLQLQHWTTQHTFAMLTPRQHPPSMRALISPESNTGDLIEPSVSAEVQGT
jgi:hypothetical protein